MSPGNGTAGPDWHSQSSGSAIALSSGLFNLEQRQQEYGKEHEYRQLMAGDVALLKGNGWFGNEGGGVYTACRR
ncbi:DUF1826 domain-containing protein [Marinobacterium aestuariivivens]|uniref:DUF1826 domain-containing protein n=1 Tax=Marinobacterium aestuariivivens TaxID=1698799 RepID=A0ABW2A3A3_9GAMM